LNTGTIAVMLFALATWLYPIKVASAETNAKRSPQTVSEVHDQAGAGTAQTDTSERQEESKETKVEVRNEAIQKHPVSTPSVGRQVVGRKSPSPAGGTYSGRHYSKEEVIQLIKDYSAQYGISASLPLKIANCESGFNQFAKNKSSSASGVFQYLASTWKATDQGKIGLSVFDADANVKAAVSYIASRGHAKPWAASQSCWD
jgi:hypothetical protein